MIRIKAKFIGEKEELGYEKGETYDLMLSGNEITRKDGSGFCFYQSIESFLKNWAVEPRHSENSQEADED